MPMSRYEIRNEYSLADPELYGAADQNDPEALLEAVSMAALVGLLRQLGDLAEFAAEIFHDLHEEVMATATRGHGLIVRVKQLEAEVPLIEKAFLSQTSPRFSSQTQSAHKPKSDYRGDLPRFIMDSCEECRGPPRLFLLDKFDVAGAGACLKRYTDPSFFKVEASSYGLSSAEVQKEKRSRKSKKKSSRWRNAGTPEILPASHSKLQQLLLEDRVENGVTDPARLVKLKRGLNRYPFGSETGKSFMENFINASLPEDKVVHEIAYGSSPLDLPSKTTSEAGSAASSLNESTSDGKSLVKPFVDEVGEGLSDRKFSSGTRQYPLQVADEKEIAVDGKSRRDGNEDGYQSDDVASEVDKYMDALATMETEIETDTEYRTKDDTGFVDMEKQGTDYDANDELLQGQFSDSQSARNSNVSEDGNNSVKKGSSIFSYSDTGSTASKNMLVDVHVAAEESPPTKVCKADVVMAMEKVSTSEDLSVTEAYQPPKLDVSDYTSNEVINIPSYESESGEPCSSLRHSDSSSTHIPLDEGEILARGILRGPQMVEIWSSHDELDTRFIKTEENSRTRGNNIPWISRHSNSTSQTKVDEPPAETAPDENYILDKLNDNSTDLCIASIHISENIREVIPKEYDDESSLDNLLAAKHEEDGGTENLVDAQIILQHTVISQAEVETSVPSFLDSETSNTVLQPDVVNSVDNVFPSAKEITLDSKLVSDSFNNSSTAEQQETECREVVLPITIGSDIDTCHEEEISNRVLPEADSGGMDISTCSTGLIGIEVTAVNKNSSYMDSGSPRSFTSFPVPSKEHDVEVGEISSNMNLIGSEAIGLEISLGSLNTAAPGSLSGEKQTKEVQSENIIVEAIVANHDNDADKVNLTHKKNPSAEEFNCVQKPDQYGFEVCDKFLPQNIDESVKQTTMVNQEIALPDLDSVQCETAFGDHSDSEMFSYVPESSLQPVKANELSSSSKYSVQHAEPVSSVQSKLHEHSGDSLLSTHHYPEARTRSEPKLTLQTDQIDLEHLHLDESNPKEVSQSEQSRCLDHPDEGSIESHSEPCFVASMPVAQVNIQADSFGMESLSGDIANYSPSSKLHLDHMDHGGNFITSPKSSLIFSPTEAMKSEISQPENHEVDISANASDEPSEVCSGFPLLPAVPQIDLIEMPPLPPLPPAQWRIGRAQQHAFMPSDRDSVQNTFGLFPQMFLLKISNDTQMGNQTSTDDLLPPVPIMRPPAVKDEERQHIYQNLLGNTVYSAQLSIQMPLTSNVGSSKVPTSDSTSIMDPCVTLSSTVNENPGHGMHAGEEGSTQSSYTLSSTTATSVDASCFFGSVPSHPLSQRQSEVCLENTAYSDQLSMQMPLTSNVGSSKVPTSDSTSIMDPCVTLSSTVNENPGHGMHAGEEGSTQLSYTSSSTTATSVDASCFSGSVPSHPLSQMQSEVCLEPGSTSLRSEVRLIKFPDTHVQQPTLADEHLKDVSTTSQGEAASSTSNSLYPALEDSTLNGNRPMKLHRPRTPLIDAVAAHDRSMLKKVKERPRPEVQKVEDRDSLLQQIRTKSFNLKPAVVTRPSIHGPKTNLRFAAILEKANAIRQALADSDEDDEDSWSDS